MHDVEHTLATLPIEVARELDAALRTWRRDDVAATGTVIMLRASAAAFEAAHREALRARSYLLGTRPGVAAAIRSGPRAVSLMLSAHMLMARAERA